MITQRALLISCTDGSHDLADLEAPHYVGPIEYAWTHRSQDDPTVLGIGPLAGTCVPGASGLVAAGRSLLWDGFHATSLAGGGRALAGLGCSLLVLRGRASGPSALVIRRLKGRYTVELVPLDPEPLWKGTHDGEGVHALLQHLLHKHAEELANMQVLATGPAAARTRFGSLCSGVSDSGAVQAPQGWFRRGGVGSRLLQVHQICAVVLGSDLTRDDLQTTGLVEGQFLDRFAPEMSLEELEQKVRYEFNPRLKAWGALGAALSAVRQRVLWFNGTSVYLTAEQRGDLYHTVLRDHYLEGFTGNEAKQEEAHQTCGEACPLPCRSVLGGRLKEVEPYVSLGPQIGVLDPAAADQVVAHCETLGFDALTLGGIIAWQMERLDRGLVEPGFLGLRARPRWPAEGFAPVEDSKHNAQLARDLTEGLLFAEWGKDLRDGLRAGARAAGPPSAPLAVYNANGDHGELAPRPYWAPGFYTPMPIPGESHQYYGIDFVPPRVLGRKSGQRMVAELMLQNFGVCRLHRGWAEEQFGDLVNAHQRTTTDWVSHHRDLARRIFRRRKARFWETDRVIEIISSYLQDYQHDAAPDAELDRWVRRFREDRASAARAYWSEINAGLEELLGS
jgi:glyceraldehyde-3-phosphate dehydrogenase (ferredoxin)